MELWQQIAIAGPLIFLAGFVDSIAGGGGLISLPAYLLVGLPPHTASGTNKLTASFGSTTSTLQYLRGGFVCKSIIPLSILFALGGSWLGAELSLLLSEDLLRQVMVVLIPPIALITLLKRDFFTAGGSALPPVRMQLYTAGIALVIGMYDGFFGPGAGTFLMLAFIGLVKLDAVTACGNTKVVNLSSNLAALATFIVNGKVAYSLAIPCILFSVAGNFLGSRLAIRVGAKAIKPVMLAVVVLLLLSLARDMAGSLG